MKSKRSRKAKKQEFPEQLLEKSRIPKYSSKKTALKCWNSAMAKFIQMWKNKVANIISDSKYKLQC